MVLEKVKQIIAGKMSISEGDITVDTKLKEDLQADSLDMVELVMAAEDEFGVEIDEDAVQVTKKERKPRGFFFIPYCPE